MTEQEGGDDVIELERHSKEVYKQGNVISRQANEIKQKCCKCNCFFVTGTLFNYIVGQHSGVLLFN